MNPTTADSLIALLEEKGVHRYGLHDISQLQHALQAATQAEQEACAPALIVAALLHDVGHMVHGLGDNPAAEGVDDRHEEIGHAWLTSSFGPEVTEPVRLHVAAKRYLCAVEPAYFGRLSPDSVLSLSLQGGPMSPAEVAAFRALPHAEDAVRLRRYDEASKVTDLATPPAEHFRPHLERCLRNAGAATDADQVRQP